MSDHAPHVDAAPAGHGHDDPMSHVPPPSFWPFFIAIALTIAPFGVLAILNKLEFGGSLLGFVDLPFTYKVSVSTGWIMVGVSTLMFLFTLMGWAHQIIKEKPLSHDPAQAQKDLKFFTVCFLMGELAIFGAIFGYFYHRKIWAGDDFTVPHGMHFGGPLVAYATFMLIASSVTCEISHHFLEHGKRGMAKFFLLLTLILGTIFLGMQGKEYGELNAIGFTPGALLEQGYSGASAFASIFYTSTGFHGLHVGIGLVMLFMVLMRLQFGHFQGHRHFSAIAASWYWHFVDIVWIFLFITIYVVR